MKFPSLYTVAVLAAALALCGCAPQPRKVAFDEAAFTPYARTGSGTIKGTAFSILRGGKKQRVAMSGSTVKLVPANAYTEEMVTRHYFNRVKLEPSDPRMAKYVRRTHPDDDGHFTFRNVPPGRYYVSCHLRWTEASTFVDDNGTFWDTDSPEDQWIYTDVSVANGQTVDVEDWNQGK